MTSSSSRFFKDLLQQINLGVFEYFLNSLHWEPVLQCVPCLISTAYSLLYVNEFKLKFVSKHVFYSKLLTNHFPLLQLATNSRIFKDLKWFSRTFQACAQLFKAQLLLSPGFKVTVQLETEGNSQNEIIIHMERSEVKL